MSPPTLSSHDLNHHRIRRKPPPTLDISDRYPSPDPLDPFAPLWVLRNRTSSGLSTHDVLESNIVNRTRSSSFLYSTTTAQVSVNTSISPTRTPSPRAKIGHYRPYSQTIFPASPQVFPLMSSPLASQPDLLYRQPFPDRHQNIRLPRQTSDMNDSSGTESDTASLPHKAAFIQPRRTASSNYRFPKFLLLRKASFLDSGKAATAKRSSMIEFQQIQKSSISPPVVSTITWLPNPVSHDSINGLSPSKKFATSLSAELPDYDSLTLTSDENTHQCHQHHKKHLMTSHDKNYLKQDLSKPRKLPSMPVSPKMLRKRISSTIPSSPKIASSTRSNSSSSYVHISSPTLALSFSQPTSDDAYTSPRKAPIPPPVSTTVQEQAPNACPDTHSTSSEWGTPTLLQLNNAASLLITGDDGKRITFGSLFESQRTIVIFIRHFWCPLCQDYMSSVKSFVRPEMVCITCQSGHHHHHQSQSQSQNHNGSTKGTGGDHDAGTRVRFVVISNGAHGMIAKYRQIFGLPFKVYTDPTLALYQVLGMGKDGDAKRHHHQTHKKTTSEGGSSDVISEKGSDIGKDGGYVKHSLMGGIAMVVMRALKVCMPVWEKGGDIAQLGGEFVFGPGLTCSYAHRMQTTKGHAPIQDVLRAAGVSVPNRTLSGAEGRRTQPESTITGRPTSLTSEKGSLKRRESMTDLRDKEKDQVKVVKRASRRYSIDIMSREEEDRWMQDRQNSIERLQEKKNIRRGMSYAASSQSQLSRLQNYQPFEMVGDHDRSDDYSEEHGPITRVAGDERPVPTSTPVNDIS